MKQAKDKAKLASMNVGIAIVKFEEEEISLSASSLQVQPHLVCAVGEAFNPEDTDEEEVLPEDYDEINVLAALAK